MRLRNMLLLILLAGPLPALQAQLLVGAYAGVNNSKLRGDTPEDVYFLNLPNADAGILIQYVVNDQLELGFQPYFTRKGTKVSCRVDKKLDPVDTAKIYLSYFSFPVMVKVITNRQKWYVTGGAELAKPIRSYYKVIGGTGEKFDISKDVTSFNVYILFGVGYRHLVGDKLTLFAELRYFQALINTIRAGTLDPVEIPRVRSRGMQLEAGLLIPLFGDKNERR